MIDKIRHWIAYREPHLEYPIFCLGARVVIYSGQWADIKFRTGRLVVIWRSNSRCMYFSPDGTPNRAIWWIGKTDNYLF